MSTVNNTNIFQLLAVLLGSGAITSFIYLLRGFGLPKQWVPPMTHIVAVAVPVLIVIVDYLAKGTFTWTGLVAAVLTGLIGAQAAAGIHSNLSNYGPSAGPVPISPVFPKVSSHPPSVTVKASHHKVPPATTVIPPTTPPTATA